MDAAPALVSQGHSSPLTAWLWGGSRLSHLQEALYPRAFLRDLNGHRAPAEELHPADHSWLSN